MPTLRDLGEFEVIRRLLEAAAVGALPADVTVPSGDDAG